MKYTINQLVQVLLQKPKEVHEVFKNFFGEEHVDIILPSEEGLKMIIRDYLTVERGLEEDTTDGSFELTDLIVTSMIRDLSYLNSVIYVWWPSVTITNENDKSVDIQDLYAKIKVGADGCMPTEYHGFFLNRSTYSTTQFVSNYMHSHISSIPKSNFRDFQRPCLGSGPINYTILTLKTDYSEEMWMLFCQELSMYVTVESIKGRPYKYLERIGGREELDYYSDYKFEYASPDLFYSEFITSDKLKQFLKYYLEKGHLKISFINSRFLCIMPYHEYMIDVSNAFIEFYNTYLKSTKENLNHLYRDKFLISASFDNGKFYKSYDVSTQSLEAYQHKFVLKFKGRDIYTNIIPSYSQETTVTLINYKLAMYVLQRILRTINYRYKNEHITRRNQDPTPVGQRVIYL